MIRIEKQSAKLLAYGEHPNVDEAFRILAEDYKAGGRKYDKVYGKLEEHYLRDKGMLLAILMRGS